MAGATKDLALERPDRTARLAARAGTDAEERPYLESTMSQPDPIIAPRDHQIEALEGLRDVLGRGPRAQAHMCCGSGKTYAQAFLAQAMLDDVEDPGREIIVCFVPNRALVQQNARNFRAVFGDDVELLGVCSETDLTGIVAEGADLETTTDPVRIASFLMRSARARLVVVTYQSAPTLRAALAEARGVEAKPLLSLFDEAHRTSGDKAESDLFAYALSDANFPLGKRAFFTATPRITEGRKTPTYSMANAEIFGPVAYTYSFRRGISDGNVVDYDLWVPIITHAELARFMEDQGLEGEDRAAVALIALGKVMERTGQERFLAYRHRVAASQSFAKDLAKVFPCSFVGHVDGSTPGAQREAMMKALGQGKALLTNCKAFVEGVDAPGLQGVVFVDPRKSVVEVVQAVGRLSRPDPEDPDKRGSIVAPILAASADPEAIDAAARSAGFQTLVQVAQALRANDDALEEDILERSRAEARGDEDLAPLRGLEVIAPEESGVDVDELAQAITVAAMETLRDSFAAQVGRLERFVVEHGHLPTRQTDSRLSSWVASVRKKHLSGDLDPAHAALLDTVEVWTWVGERTPPEKIAGHLCAFRDRCQRMPSLKRGTGAEADLHAYLMEGQEIFLRRGAEASPLTGALAEANLLFFAEEVLGKRAQVSGRFEVTRRGAEPEVWFHPRLDRNRKTIPVFRSGHTVPPRPFRVHVGRAERERLTALGANHSVRVTLVRAGITRDPFRDARVLAWHAGTVDRGETPDDSKDSFGWLLARLRDRKVSGRPAYLFANRDAKRIRECDPATALHPAAPEGTAGEVLERIDRLRRAMRAGRIDAARLAPFDAAPGFSWIEPWETDPDIVALCVAHVAEVLGPGALGDRQARLRDCGFANTLRSLDEVLEDAPEAFTRVDAEMCRVLASAR
jgi:superfamily II DNA or RNA helicase